jgi:NADH-quinone oxidoreductase subunit C
MKPEELIESINKSLPGIIKETNQEDSPVSIKVDAKDIRKICQYLRDQEDFYFDQCSCVTGIDNGPEVGSMEIVYNLYSIVYDHHLMIKLELDRSNPQVDTISDIWKTADWLERETYDLLGIDFKDHPDQRRILLPKDWEGHPLRKDYKLQEYYHGVKVEY